MRLVLIATAALISISIATGAEATPSLSYAQPPNVTADAELVDAKFKFKKLGHSPGFRRGQFGGSRFGHRSYGHRKHGHFGKRIVKKGHVGKKFPFGKGFFPK